MLIYRQGDVALVRVSELPHSAKAVQKAGTVILAEGEATGHAHTITSIGVALYEEPSTKTRYLTADELLELTHQEHATIKVEPGVYEIRRQREYSPGEIRRVRD